MDPLSFTASVIAVIGAATVVLNSIYQLKALLGAHEAIDALIGEVGALQALLKDSEEAQTLLEQVDLTIHQYGLC